MWNPGHLGVFVFLRLGLFCNFFCDSFFERRLFKRVLFNFPTSVNFSYFLLLFMPNLVLLGSEKTLCMVSVFSYLWKFALWPNIWSFLEKVLCMFGKKVCFAMLGGEFCMSVLDLGGILCGSSPLFPDSPSGLGVLPVCKVGECSLKPLFLNCLFLL